MKKECFKGCFGLKEAFTLIELLVVVLIIGILAAVAVPQYEQAVAKSRAVEAVTLLDAIIRAEEVYYLANGEYTLDIKDLDIDIPSDKLGYHAADPNSYFFYSEQKGKWVANAANVNLPKFEFTGKHISTQGARWCRTNDAGKTEKAVKICKSMGTQGPDMSTGYFLLN